MDNKKLEEWLQQLQDRIEVLENAVEMLKKMLWLCYKR